jgi:hypothetical protein
MMMKHVRDKSPNWLVLISLVLLLAGTKAGVAEAATTIVVNSPATNVADDGRCTLIEAIVAANTDVASGGQAGECAAGSGADVIQLAAGAVYSLTESHNDLGGPNGLPPISTIMTIVGNGATIERSGLSFVPPFRLFYIELGGALTLEKVTVQNGQVINSDAASKPGGAVYNQGQLTVVDSTFFSNQSRGGAGADGGLSGGGGGGGAAGFGGAIYNDGGTVAITNSTFSANRAIGGAGGRGWTVAGGPNGNGGQGGGAGGSGGVPGFPGGAGAFGGGGGGGSGSAGIGSEGGAAGFGGGGGGGGAKTSGGPGGSGGLGSFDQGAGGKANSVSGGGGGGGAGLGGALFNNGGQIALLNSTFADNGASGGLGGEAQVPLAKGEAGLGLGGGIFANGGIVTVQNSLIADSAISGVCYAVDPGSLVSQGFNLIGDTSCGAAFTATGDLVDIEPLLDGLQPNGGGTPTHALLPDSPAIDGITDPAACSLTADQRGEARPQGQFCDIGAYEAAVEPPDGATLILTKIVAGAPPSTGWQFTLNGAGLANFGPAGGSRQLALPAGTYRLAEMSKFGYAVTATCDNGLSGSSEITLNLVPNETVACTFRNQNARPANALTIINESLPAEATGFAFSGDIGDFSLDDGQAHTQTDLSPGTYQVVELRAALPDPFWALVYVRCEVQTGGLTDVVYPPVEITASEFTVPLPLEAGQNVTCVFHNERVNFNGDEEDGPMVIYLPLVRR